MTTNGLNVHLKDFQKVLSYVEKVKLGSKNSTNKQNIRSKKTSQIPEEQKCQLKQAQLQAGQLSNVKQKLQ